MDVIAAHARQLHDALEEAEASGSRHVMIDGVLISPIRVARSAPTSGIDLAEDEACFNAMDSAIRVTAGRSGELLRMTFTALHHVTVGPWRIRSITTAAPAIPYLERHHTV